MNYLIEIIEAEYYKEYILLLSFSDGTKKFVDLKEEIIGEALESLRDLNLFKNFHINKEFGTIEWPNGIDMAPDGLYEMGIKVEKIEAA